MTTNLRWYSMTVTRNDASDNRFFTGYFSTDVCNNLIPINGVYEGQDYETHDPSSNILVAPASWVSPDGKANKFYYTEDEFEPQTRWQSVHALFLASDTSFTNYDPSANVAKNVLFGPPLVFDPSGNPYQDASGNYTDASGNIIDETTSNQGEYMAYDASENPLVVKGSDYVIPITYDINFIIENSVPSCFNHGTKILCLNKNLEEEYIPVQDLRSGDFVKTYKHGYRKIDLIGKNPMINNPDVFTSCMYKMKKTEENGLTEDLIVTGGHCLLVDDLGEFKEKNDKIFGSTLMIDDKYMLLCGVSTDFVKLENRLPYTYYHFILENNGDDDERFGVWANGILTETPSKNQFNAHKYTIM